MPSVGIEARIVTEISAIAPYLTAWDHLAVEAARPYCAPAWQVSWWQARSPANAGLRIVTLTDDGELIGVLPLYEEATPTHTRTWRQLCAGFTTRVSPLAAPGRESAVAAAAARLLAEPGGPELLALEGLPPDIPWGELLREQWPTTPRPVLHRDQTMETPIADLADGFDAWLARRGKTARRMAAERRSLERRGFEIRIATAEEQDAAIDTLCRLYRERWRERGGTDRPSEATAAMLRAAAPELGDRFRIFQLHAPEEVVAAALFVGAGRELSAWGGGFDERWHRLSPLNVLRLAAVDYAASRGYERLEFGEGVQPHKLHFADRCVPLEWVTLFPVTRRYPLVRARLVPKHTRVRTLSLARRLPEPLQRRLRSLRKTFRG